MLFADQAPEAGRGSRRARRNRSNRKKIKKLNHSNLSQRRKNLQIIVIFTPIRKMCSTISIIDVKFFVSGRRRQKEETREKT